MITSRCNLGAATEADAIEQQLKWMQLERKSLSRRAAPEESKLLAYTHKQ